jgi:hypothetical protein
MVMALLPSGGGKDAPAPLLFFSPFQLSTDELLVCAPAPHHPFVCAWSPQDLEETGGDGKIPSGLKDAAAAAFPGKTDGKGIA